MTNSGTVPRCSVVFVTDRGKRHQEAAVAAAPPEAEVTVLRRPDRATLIHHLTTAEVLVTERQGRIDAPLIAAAPRLQLIQRLGSMVHDIDLEAARHRGIPVCCQPLISCMAVAEHAMMLTLSLLKRLPEVTAIAMEDREWGPARRTNEDTFCFNWSRRENLEMLAKQSVGILGLGEIGMELARRLKGFAPAAVIYHKRTPLPGEVEKELNLIYSEVTPLLQTSRVLFVLLPYTSETEHFIDKTALASMPRGAILVHCGSGGVIDEAALARALETGHLAGAGLDTYEWEPLTPGNPLLPLARCPANNVILTPHTAAGTHALARQEKKKNWENVRRLLKGQPLQNRVA